LNSVSKAEIRRRCVLEWEPSKPKSWMGIEEFDGRIAAVFRSIAKTEKS
jgi:hypothetical protein